MKCSECFTYTLKSICPNCGKSTNRIKVLKYSPEDNYGEYRRKIKYYNKNELN